MQTVLTSFIILIATLYVAKQWLPSPLKQRLSQIFGKNLGARSNTACGSCSTCGGCGNTNAEKKIIVTKTITKTS